MRERTATERPNLSNRCASYILHRVPVAGSISLAMLAIRSMDQEFIQAQGSRQRREQSVEIQHQTSFCFAGQVVSGKQ